MQPYGASLDRKTVIVEGKEVVDKLGIQTPSDAPWSGWALPPLSVPLMPLEVIAYA